LERGDLEIWLNHFEHHARRPFRLEPGLADALRPDEKRLIARSLAVVQLVEPSEALRARVAAERFARAREIPQLARIIELLIEEEKRHATLVREFMCDHQLPLRRAHWIDRVFRRIRGLGGLHLYLWVQLCAELIGIVFYRALEVATGCERLQRLCRLIVADELAHIGFESQLLGSMRAGRAGPGRALERAAHLTFFASAVLVVWATHRAVLRRAGHGARSFLRSCLAQYEFYLAPACLPLERSHAASSSG